MASIEPLRQFRLPYSLSVYTTTRPQKLSKTIRLGPDGEAIKEAGGAMVYGQCETFSADTPEHFLALLKLLTPAQALGFGVLKGNRREASICPKDRPSQDSVPRTKDFFAWPEGPGILMLDYDPPPGENPMTKGQLLEAFYTVAPKAKDAPHIWSASAGSCIYHSKTGDQVIGLRGQRIYLFVANAREIPNALWNSYERGILCGYGWPFFTSHGKVSPRCLFDLSTGQPNRYDFAGGAECIPPLIQKRPDPELFNAKAPWADLDVIFPPVEGSEKSTFDRIIRDICSSPRVLEIQDQKKKEFMKAKGLDDAAYRKIYERDILPLDMVITFHTGEKATVKDILRLHPKFHRMECHDPVEPEYRGMDGKIAICYSDTHGMPPRIFSQAHGGKNYLFETYDAVEQLLDTYAVVNNRGTTHIVEIRPDDIHTVDVQELKKLWANRPATRVLGDKVVKMDAVKLFLESSKRKDYCGWTFCRRGEEPPNTLNEWRGPYLQPKQGDWSRFQYLCKEILCRGNPTYYDYLMLWLAEACINIGPDKPGIALILYGEEGTGKNQFFEYFRPILGPFSILIDDNKRIFSDFNMHLRNQQVVYLDESVVPQDKKHRSQFKGMITNTERGYNQKNRPLLTLPDPSRYILATNDEHVVQASWDARRFFVLNVSSNMRRNYTFFKELNEERNAGGVEALYHHLLSMKWRMTDIRTPPHTEFLHEQMILSSRHHEQWWHECLEMGRLVALEYVPSYSGILPEMFSVSRLDIAISDLPNNRKFRGRLAMTRELLYNSYLGWMRRQGERSVLTAARFARFMTSVIKPHSEEDPVCIRLCEGKNGLILQQSGNTHLSDAYILLPDFPTLLNLWKLYTSRT